MQQVNNSARNDILTPQYMCCLIGSVLYWSWLFLLDWTGMITCTFSFEINLLCTGISFFGLALSMLAIFLCCRKNATFLRKKSFGLVVPSLLAPFSGAVQTFIIASGIMPSPVILCICWILSGFGIAALLVECSELMTDFTGDAMTLLMFMTMILSCTNCLFIIKLGVVAALSFNIVAPCLGLLVSRYGRKNIQAIEEAPDSETSSSFKAASKDKALGASASDDVAASAPVPAEVRRFQVLSTLRLVLFGAVFSFGQFSSFCIAPSVGFGVFDYFWISLYLSAILFLGFGVVAKRKISVQPIELTLLIVTVLSLVIMTLANLNSGARFFFCVLLGMGFTSFDKLSLYEQARTTAKNKLPFSQYFVEGRFANAAGMFIGWAVVEASVLLCGGSPDNTQFQVGLVFLVICLIIFSAVTAQFSDYDIDSLYVTPPAIFASVHVGQAYSDCWNNSVQRISKDAKLSPREAEVFGYLVRGRDSNFIAEHLIISTSTVKTHSSHIYGKVGVHSQQQLISLVEDYVRRAEAEKQNR